jgi:hypothetical protein
MPYVSRNGAGQIIGLHHLPQEAEAEWLEGDDLQIQQFLSSCAAPTEQARRSLSDSDSEMIRVIEDLVELLITKNVFTFTELPEAVQRKLSSRRRLREDLGMLNHLIDKDDRIF